MTPRTRWIVLALPLIALPIALAATSRSQEGNMMAGVVSKTVNQRTALLDPAEWIDTEILVVVAGDGAADSMTETVKAKELVYRHAAGGVSLVVVSPSRWAYSFVAVGQRSFYVLYENDLYPGRLGAGILEFRRSILRLSTPEEGFPRILAEFGARIDDGEVQRLTGRGARQVVDLRNMGRVPFAFWSAGGTGSSQVGDATIDSVALVDNVLRLDLRSSGDVYEGTFWIDWTRKALLRSSVRRRG